MTIITSTKKCEKCGAIVNFTPGREQVTCYQCLCIYKNGKLIRKMGEDKYTFNPKFPFLSDEFSEYNAKKSKRKNAKYKVKK